MQNKKTVDMTFKEIINSPLEERTFRMKEFRAYMINIINKLYTKAIKYDFKFSKDEEELTLYEIVQELNTFLKSKNFKDEEISEIIYNGVKK